MRAALTSAASTRLLLGANLTGNHDVLADADAALSCEWMAEAHGQLETHLCEGVADSWALLAVLLLLLGCALIFEALHASTLVGPRPWRMCPRLCGGFAPRAPRRSDGSDREKKAKPSRGRRGKVAASETTDADAPDEWEAQREAERLEQEAIAAEKAARHAQRETKRRAAPVAAPRDFSSAFVTARMHEIEDERAQVSAGGGDATVKMAWGGAGAAGTCVRAMPSAAPVGCFDD